MLVRLSSCGLLLASSLLASLAPGVEAHDVHPSVRVRQAGAEARTGRFLVASRRR